MKFKSLLNTLMCITLLLLASQNGHSQTRGTVDGGGANGIKSQLIESKKLIPSDYNLYTSAFIDLLAASSNNFEQQYDFREYVTALKNILSMKKWYILPTKLSNIGRDLHGIPADTNQFAIHFSEEVFVSEVEFKTNLEFELKDAEKIKIEQNKIIFHELIMGLRLLFKSNLYTQCVYSNVKTKEDLSLNLCGRDYPSNTENQLTITPKDHEAVRILTDEFINILNSNDHQNVKFEQIVYYFKKYNLINSQINPIFNQRPEIKAQDLGKKIFSQMVIKRNKLFCGHNKNITHDLLREWEVAKVGTQFPLKSTFEVFVEVYSIKNNYTLFVIKSSTGATLEKIVLKNSDKVDGHFYHTKAVDYGSKEIGKYARYDISNAGLSENIGDKRRSYTFEFDTQLKSLISFEAQDFVVFDKEEKSINGTNVTGVSSTNIMEKALICSDKSIITLEKN